MQPSKSCPIYRSVCAAIFVTDLLLGCAPAFGQFTPSTLPQSMQEIYRFHGEIYRGFPDDIHINRRGELVTVLSNQPQSSKFLSLYLLNYSPQQGLSSFALPFDHRVFSLSFSDWGTVALTDSRNSTPFKVLSGRFGTPLQELFNLDRGTIGSPGINDNGVVAFASRNDYSYGLRDLWRYTPGQPLESLPDLGEDSLRGPTLVDPLGRVVQSHWMDGVIPLDEATMRLDGSGQWHDLTANFGEPDERVFDLMGTNAINAAGDFVFASGRYDGQFTYRLNAYSAATGSITQLISTTTDLLQEIHQLSIADNGDVLFMIGSNNPGFDSYIYRKNANALVNLSSMIPQGNSLYTYPAMNQNGDVIFGAWDPVSRLYSSYLLPPGSSAPTKIDAISNLVAPMYAFALSNDRRPYFWLQMDNQQWILGTAPIPEPSVAALGVIGVILLASRTARRHSQLQFHRAATLA